MLMLSNNWKNAPPKKSDTWTMGETEVIIPHLSSILQKWLISKKLNGTYGFPGSLSKILGTPVLSKDPMGRDSYSSSTLKTSGKDSLEVRLSLNSIQEGLNSSFNEEHASGMPIQETCEDIEVAVSKLCLTSRPSSLDDHCWNLFQLFCLLAGSQFLRL